jgi:hypothetical protein
MTTTESGEEAQRKPYSAKVDVGAYSSTSCAFCWFFLTIYPTLEGMVPNDKAIFAAHLKKSHGLGGEIQQ